VEKKSYKDLIVWQRAMDLVVEVYSLTKLLPREELYGLTNQLRRAAVSIPSNIAEGNSRNTTREYVQFLNIALGSKAEAETQIEICERLGYLSEDQTETAVSLCHEVGKILNAIINKLSPKPSTRRQSP
jgi:four helix bundle protein